MKRSNFLRSLLALPFAAKAIQQITTTPVGQTVGFKVAPGIKTMQEMRYMPWPPPQDMTIYAAFVERVPKVGDVVEIRHTIP